MNNNLKTKLLLVEFSLPSWIPRNVTLATPSDSVSFYRSIFSKPTH